MTSTILAGSFTSALTHFAGYGLVSMLEEAGRRDLRLQWDESAEPVLKVIGFSGVGSELGSIVNAHALRHADVTSWVQRKTTVRRKEKKVEIGLFSPRIAAPETSEAWKAIYNERREVLDESIGASWLDARLLQALGEPAYWQFGEKDPQYDEGASRWEMKTRNSGEDFVRNRLARLAINVSERDPVVIEKALTEGVVDDSAGKLDSRTGTGLVPPGPVDDALAWCALWGIGAFQVFPRLAGVAITPGAWPTDRVHPWMMALPMFTTPQSVAKLRRILRSQEFCDAAFGDTNDRGSIVRVRAQDQLRSFGIRGIVKFPIRKAGSTSAPERQVLSGHYESI